MATMTTREVRDNVGRLWETAAQEPVIVVSAGERVAVVLSPQEFDRITGKTAEAHPGPQFGFAKNLLSGVDVDALLAVPVEDAFEHDHRLPAYG